MTDGSEHKQSAEGGKVGAQVAAGIAFWLDGPKGNNYSKKQINRWITLDSQFKTALS